MLLFFIKKDQRSTFKQMNGLETVLERSGMNGQMNGLELSGSC